MSRAAIWSRGGARTGALTLTGDGHPNPFNPSTTVALKLRQAGRARLSIHDLAGRRVSLLADGYLDVGSHQFVWDGRDERGARAGRLGLEGETRQAVDRQ